MTRKIAAPRYRRSAAMIIRIWPAVMAGNSTKAVRLTHLARGLPHAHHIIKGSLFVPGRGEKVNRYVDGRFTASSPRPGYGDR
jgi:hypothetical protein